MTLDVQEIFPTLQGEGPYTGWPAVFVRLGGCNLACHFCDTEFESFENKALDEMINEVDRLSCDKHGNRIRSLVVITGGEPLRQPIERLCGTLIEQGFKVQIETNGTLYRAVPEDVDIICSPKMSQQHYHPIREDLLPRIQALKFIISAGDDSYKSVEEVGQSAYNIPVYVQPMNEEDEAKNSANLAHATKLAMEYGYRLSIQTHRLAGLK